MLFCLSQWNSAIIPVLAVSLLFFLFVVSPSCCNLLYSPALPRPWPSRGQGANVSSQIQEASQTVIPSNPCISSTCIARNAAPRRETPRGRASEMSLKKTACCVFPNLHLRAYVDRPSHSCCLTLLSLTANVRRPLPGAGAIALTGQREEFCHTYTQVAHRRGKCSRKGRCSSRVRCVCAPDPAENELIRFLTVPKEGDMENRRSSVMTRSSTPAFDNTCQLPPPSSSQ